MKWLNQLIAIALVTSLASPLAAQELSFTAAVDGTNVADDGVFFLSDTSDTVRADLTLGYEVYRNLIVFAEYHTGSEHAPVFDTMTMDFATHAARFGVQYRYPLLSWLHPYVLAGVGFNWGDIDLETDTNTYDDTDFGVSGFVLGGIALVWYFGDPADQDASALQRMGIGLTNDYGYTFGPGYTFDELQPEDGGGDPVANLGEVDMSGFTWRVGITLRDRF
jgi:hypothetical protein